MITAFLQEQREVLYICIFYNWFNWFNSQHLVGWAAEIKLNVLLFPVTCGKRTVCYLLSTDLLTWKKGLSSSLCYCIITVVSWHPVMWKSNCDVTPHIYAKNWMENVLFFFCKIWYLVQTSAARTPGEQLSLSTFACFVQLEPRRDENHIWDLHMWVWNLKSAVSVKLISTLAVVQEACIIPDGAWVKRESESSSLSQSYAVFTVLFFFFICLEVVWLKGIY